MHIEDFVSRLDKVQHHGNHYAAICPSHDDKNPSLGVSEGRDGRILLKCWAGCTPQEIVADMGLEMKDLFPESNLTPHQKQQYKREKTTAELESAAYHELLILMQTLGNRVTSRQLEHDHKFRDARPDWRPYPNEHWEREKLAAKRAHKALEVVYGL